MRKEVKKLLDSCVKKGWTLVRNKHYKLTAPNGNVVTVSATSNSRGLVDSIQKDIKRAEALK